MEENTKATETVEERGKNENPNKWYDYVLLSIVFIVIVILTIILGVLKLVGLFFLCLFNPGSVTKDMWSFDEMLGLGMIYHDWFCNK